MRSIIWLCISTALLSACATVPTNTSNLAPKEKLAFTLEEIKVTYKNRATASCQSIDKAMAFTYTMFRTFDNKKLVKDPTKKLEGTSLILKGIFTDLKTEYNSRCPGKPIQYLAIKELYPEIAEELERRQAEKVKQQ